MFCAKSSIRYIKEGLTKWNELESAPSLSWSTWTVVKNAIHYMAQKQQWGISGGSGVWEVPHQGAGGLDVWSRLASVSYRCLLTVTTHGEGGEGISWHLL